MPNPWLPAAMQALEALHQEFDVADSTAGQFDVKLARTQPLAGQLFADPFAGGGHGLNGGEVERSGVDGRFDKLEQRVAGRDGLRLRHVP